MLTGRRILVTGRGIGSSILFGPSGRVTGGHYQAKITLTLDPGISEGRKWSSTQKGRIRPYPNQMGPLKFALSPRGEKGGG